MSKRDFFQKCLQILLTSKVYTALNSSCMNSRVCVKPDDHILQHDVPVAQRYSIALAAQKVSGSIPREHR